CQGAEKHLLSSPSPTGITQRCDRFDETIARSAMYTANHLVGAKAIICLTESGSTPLWMSRIRSGLPILALTPNDRTLRRMALYRGVEPMYYDFAASDEDKMLDDIIAHLKGKALLEDGDLVILTRGAKLGEHGGTNSMQVIQA
ncbi:MAG: pyruvate kinase alpha/beta domain-containing protein, partial [Pontibacterium sp.]